MFLILVQDTTVCLAQVTRLELESDRTSTIRGLEINVKAKAFDTSNNAVNNFNVAYDIVEGPVGGTLGATQDCEGEAAGSGHCVRYTPPANIGFYHVRATLTTDPAITVQREIEVVACVPYPTDGSQLNCNGPIISPGFDHKGDVRLAVIFC